MISFIKFTNHTPYKKLVLQKLDKLFRLQAMSTHNDAVYNFETNAIHAGQDPEKWYQFPF